MRHTVCQRLLATCVVVGLGLPLAAEAAAPPRLSGTVGTFYSHEYSSYGLPGDVLGESLSTTMYGPIVNRGVANYTLRGGVINANGVGESRGTSYQRYNTGADLSLLPLSRLNAGMFSDFDWTRTHGLWDEDSWTFSRTIGANAALTPASNWSPRVRASYADSALERDFEAHEGIAKTRNLRVRLVNSAIKNTDLETEYSMRRTLEPERMASSEQNRVFIGSYSRLTSDITLRNYADLDWFATSPTEGVKYNAQTYGLSSALYHNVTNRHSLAHTYNLFYATSESSHTVLNNLGSNWFYQAASFINLNSGVGFGSEVSSVSQLRYHKYREQWTGGLDFTFDIADSLGLFPGYSYTAGFVQVKNGDPGTLQSHSAYFPIHYYGLAQMPVRLIGNVTYLQDKSSISVRTLTRSAHAYIGLGGLESPQALVITELQTDASVERTESTIMDVENTYDEQAVAARIISRAYRWYGELTGGMSQTWTQYIFGKSSQRNGFTSWNYYPMPELRLGADYNRTRYRGASGWGPPRNDVRANLLYSFRALQLLNEAFVTKTPVSELEWGLLINLSRNFGT